MNFGVDVDVADAELLELDDGCVDAGFEAGCCWDDLLAAGVGFEAVVIAGFEEAVV